MEFVGAKADLRTLGLVATILLLGAFFGFVGGKAVSNLPGLGPVVEIDNRVAVVLSPQQKAEVLKSMRLDLEALQGIQAALSAGDMQAVAKIAGQRGSDANPIAPALGGRLSNDWKATDRDLRQNFDDIAVAGTSHESVETILSLNARAMKACIACHQAYHIVLPTTLQDRI